jgi:DNA-binding beta-propeller fold protein YncE
MPAKHSIESLCSARVRLLAAAAMVTAFLLLLAASASADYEQAGHFGESGEEAQLSFSTSAAVNSSGAGGVPAGSLYVTAAERVLRYSPGAEGDPPQFAEAWGWGVADRKEEFERCGPALGTTCTSHGQTPFGGEAVGDFEGPPGVAVDQTTGYVYVVNEHSMTAPREHNLIEVFSADGSHLIARFGEGGPTEESFEEAPEKIDQVMPDSLAVDRFGDVYVGDRKFPPGQEFRTMRFEPQSPGDYEHYVYSGRLTDIRGEGIVRVDDAGNVYTAREDGSIDESAPGNPTPICTYTALTGYLEAMTVNQSTGDVFYAAKGKVYGLESCKEGTFHEDQAPIKAEPVTRQLAVMTFDPSRIWSAGRPDGVLYAIDDEEHSELVHGLGDVFAPAIVRAPSVNSESVTSTGINSTTLHAEIDPHGFTTRFTFQYLTDAAYEANESADRFAGAAEAPIGGATIGGGAVGQAAAAISALLPETEYRFRVIATSECEGPGEPPCETVGELSSFNTFPAETAGLPDGRDYELVSPAEKHGGEVFPAEPDVASCYECKPPSGGFPGPRSPMQSAPDGNAVVYEGFPFSLSEGAQFYNEYLSTRVSSGGWHTTILSPPLPVGGAGYGIQDFDATLSSDVLLQSGRTTALSPLAPAGYDNLYSQSVADPGAFSPLVTSAPPNRTTEAFHLEYVGHSTDFTRQFFAANDALTEAPDPGSGSSDLYESASGGLKLVNILPGNAAVAAGSAFASVSPDRHAISDDGSHVFWTAGGHLYVRENGETTVEIKHAGAFLTASSDGERVLLSDGCLYEVAAEACEDLTGGDGGFTGLVGQSEDLSHVYFVDTAVLNGAEPEHNEQGVEPQSGKSNLYFWDEGQIHFVTTLATNIPQTNGYASDTADWLEEPSLRTAEASPDGVWLAFTSYATLTGYSNFGPTCARDSTGAFVAHAPCSEVFVYDSTTDGMRCVSCNPSGEPPLGSSTLRRIEGETKRMPQPRYLTDAGRLFFDSSDRLSPFDVNGRVEDVYEFEPQGIGDCQVAAGCVRLISPGSGAVDSNFLTMDESGANVFFTTRERLVLIDKDELIDLYDAREGGGTTVDSETTHPECQGEACQPAVAPPNDSTPGSATFEGAGNVSSSPKAKPKAKSLTRAQKLAKALKACRGKPKRTRNACERAAHKRYGVPAKKVIRNRKRGK